MIEQGYLLANRYRIMDTIGEGGMANVYLAEDEYLHRQVAVKVLRMNLQNDQATIRRFQREAHATSELSHPNIVSIYDVGSDQGIQYIVMEYIQGMDLKDFIEANFPIPLTEVVQMMLQILSAVQLAHSKGIIHRDLKPQNILVTPKNQVKIADFGIAVALSSQSATQTNSLLGSVHYISPEQARGGMATPRSDIYALGIILYELLAGKVPFAGDSAVSIALKHFNEDIPSLRDDNETIPQPLENVVLKATAKSPDNRYQSAAAMASDLRTALDPARRDEAKYVAPVQDHNLGKTKVLGDLPKKTQTNLQQADAAQDEDKKKQPQPTKPKKKMSKKKKAWLISGGVVLLLLLSLGLWLILSNKDVNVPDLTNMSVTEAQAALKTRKLKLGEKTYEYDADVQKDHVIRTDPRKQHSVKTNSSVDLVLSRGAKKYKLGDYRELTYSVVRSKLKKLGFTVKRKKVSSDTINAGQIISQSIDPDTKVVPAKTTITFRVSSGPKMITLHDLKLSSKEEAQNYADEVGLTLNFEEAYSDTIPLGRVISQDPEAKTKVEADSEVTLVISLGEKPKADDDSSSQNSQNSSSAQDKDNQQSQSSQNSTVTLSNLVGITQAQAQSYLSQNGLSINVTSQYSDTVASGKVISQKPTAGSSVKKGSTVTVVVSKGSNSTSSN